MAFVVKLYDSPGTTANLIVVCLVFKGVRNLFSSSSPWRHKKNIIDESTKKVRKKSPCLLPAGHHE